MIIRVFPFIEISIILYIYVSKVVCSQMRCLWEWINEQETHALSRALPRVEFWNQAENKVRKGEIAHHGNINFFQRMFSKRLSAIKTSNPVHLSSGVRKAEDFRQYQIIGIMSSLWHNPLMIRSPSICIAQPFQPFITAIGRSLMAFLLIPAAWPVRKTKI